MFQAVWDMTLCFIDVSGYLGYDTVSLLMFQAVWDMTVSLLRFQAAWDMTLCLY